MISLRDFFRPYSSGQSRHATFGPLAVLVLLIVSGLNVARAQTYADIYNFDGTAHGCCPDYPQVVAQGRDGNLYGVTSGGGTNGVGVVFKITPAGTLTVLYNFDTTHGATPRGGLTLGGDGNFYGTTDSGGTSGFGTIFKITTTRILTVLYNFTGAADGGHPDTPPTMGSDGNFYGTTSLATAYKITPTGTFTLLGATPGRSFSPLIQAGNGIFYGTTPEGGTNGTGSVFKLTASGTVSVLYSFDTTHGAAPYGPLIQGSDGNLYGTTTAGGARGGGVVFKLTLNGALSLLHSFVPNVPTDGNFPIAGLIQATDGNFYGVTSLGGNVDSGLGGHGVIFKIVPATKAYSVLYNFDGTNGSTPEATPVQHTNGKIYGLTNQGGSLSEGVVYSFDLSLAPFVKLFSTSGKIGATIQTEGTGFTGTTNVSFNGVAATFTIKSDTFLTTTVPPGATTGFVTVTTPNGTLTSSVQFKVVPTVSGFSPSSGPVGTDVTITGTGLTQTNKVTFGGVAATTLTVNSDTQVTATVPTGAITGKIVVTTPGGTASSSAVFTVVAAPTVSGFSPTSGPVGTIVVITGSGLTGTSKVTFGGVVATTFTVDSDTQVTATVPTGAVSGNIAVTTPGGTATSSGIFTVTVSGCASGVISEEIFDASMHGCAGAVSHSNRSAQCAAGWHACTAAEWNAHRGATVPGHIYWTGDNPLNFVSGVTNSCTVSATQGTNICGANSSMLVCSGSTDPEGNTCQTTGCGLDTKIPQFFGGCPGIPSGFPSAGTLCCSP